MRRPASRVGNQLTGGFLNSHWRPGADAQSKIVDTLLVSLLSAVFAAFGHGLWWTLKKARLVRSELNDGGSEVLEGAAVLALSVIAILVSW